MFANELKEREALLDEVKLVDTVVLEKTGTELVELAKPEEVSSILLVEELFTIAVDPVALLDKLDKEVVVNNELSVLEADVELEAVVITMLEDSMKELVALASLELDGALDDVERLGMLDRLVLVKQGSEIRDATVPVLIHETADNTTAAFRTSDEGAMFGIEKLK